MKGRKEKGEKKKEKAQRRIACMCLLNLCVELCVCRVSSDRGWGGLDEVDLATVRPISSSAV